MPDGDKEFKFIKPGEVRVRIAPAPTGFLHIGTARTALFNYLFAKKYQGSFILRIEDTDAERSKKGSEKNILNSLKWLGIKWEEGPIADDQNQKYIGNYGPYRQSKRLHIYTKYLKKLISEGKAYYCFCSEEDLEAQKQYLMSQGKPPIYNGKCAQLPQETITKYLEEGKPSIIRFKTPAKKIVFEDLIREKIEFETELLGDFSLAKSLQEPLYNFACAVDDFEMKISHVIRGEDHISNTPKQILIQQALDFPTPKYAHLPLILGPDKAKLSKRHGAVAISDYKNDGYLPEAVVNFMAFLGWNPGTEREIYSMASLIKEFSFERVKRGGAVFNINRLDYLNGFYIRQRPIEKLTEDCLPFLVEDGFIDPVFKSEERMPDLIGFFGKEIVLKFIIKETKEEISFDYLQGIVSIYKERLKKLSEISELTDFFFRAQLDYKKELLRWKNQSDKEVIGVLDRLAEILSNVEGSDWNKKNLEKILTEETEKWKETDLKPERDRGYLLWPLRVALTGKQASAGPFEIAEILGKDKTLKRVGEAREKVQGLRFKVQV